MSALFFRAHVQMSAPTEKKRPASAARVEVEQGSTEATGKSSELKSSGEASKRQAKGAETVTALTKSATVAPKDTEAEGMATVVAKSKVPEERQAGPDPAASLTGDGKGQEGPSSSDSEVQMVSTGRSGRTIPALDLGRRPDVTMASAWDWHSLMENQSFGKSSWEGALQEVHLALQQAAQAPSSASVRAIGRCLDFLNGMQLYHKRMELQTKFEKKLDERVRQLKGRTDQSRFRELQNKVKGLEEQLLAWEGKVAKQKKVVKALRNSISDQERDLEQERGKVSLLTSLNAKAHARVAQVSAEKMALDAKMDQLQLQLASTRDLKCTLERRLVRTKQFVVRQGLQCIKHHRYGEEQDPFVLERDLLEAPCSPTRHIRDEMARLAGEREQRGKGPNPSPESETSLPQSPVSASSATMEEGPSQSPVSEGAGSSADKGVLLVTEESRRRVPNIFRMAMGSDGSATEDGGEADAESKAQSPSPSGKEEKEEEEEEEEEEEPEGNVVKWPCPPLCVAKYWCSHWLDAECLMKKCRYVHGTAEQRRALPKSRVRLAQSEQFLESVQKVVNMGFEMPADLRTCVDNASRFVTYFGKWEIAGKRARPSGSKRKTPPKIKKRVHVQKRATPRGRGRGWSKFSNYHTSAASSSSSSWASRSCREPEDHGPPGL